jgi:hypothetical protein
MSIYRINNGNHFFTTEDESPGLFRFLHIPKTSTSSIIVSGNSIEDVSVIVFNIVFYPTTPDYYTYIFDWNTLKNLVCYYQSGCFLKIIPIIS